MAKKRKLKLRIDRLIIVLIVIGVVGFGLYRGASWVVGTISSYFQKEEEQIQTNEEETVTEKEYIATIVIDPGHGDWDPGANVGDVLEKNITLTTAKAIGDTLEEANIKAVFTRESDISLSNNKIEDLKKRAAMSAENNADYFVSIHVNSFEESDDVSGFEIYTKNDESQSLAQNIGSSIETFNYSKNRGIIDGERSLQVLRDNTVPSVLLELGYINNANDYAYLSDDQKLQKLGEAIAQGIINEVSAHNSETITQNNTNE